MDVGCTLDLGQIIDLGCGLLHPHRALYLQQLSFLFSIVFFSLSVYFCCDVLWCVLFYAGSHCNGLCAFLVTFQINIFLCPRMRPPGLGLVYTHVRTRPYFCISGFNFRRFNQSRQDYLAYYSGESLQATFVHIELNDKPSMRNPCRRPFDHFGFILPKVAEPPITHPN